jgi:streptogramin lyase
MQGHANVWIISAALSLSGCAQGALEEPQREPAARTARSAEDPYGVTPPRSANAGAGGQSGKGGANSFGGGGTHAGGALATGGASSAGAGSSAVAGMATSGGAVGSPSSAGGGSAMLGTGGSSADSTNECPSLTRVRLANGACVDRVSEFSVATDPAEIVTGSDGRIWFDDGSGNQIVQLDDQGRVLSRLPCEAGSDPRQLAPGRGDVILWYSAWHEKTLTRLSQAMQRTASQLGFTAAALSQGEGAELWLTDAGHAVYRFDSGDSSLERWPAAPNDRIIFGPGKNPWFPEGTLIARLTAAEGKQSFPISDSFADDICAGPDDALWFSDGSLNQIGRMAADGTLSRTYDLPLNSQPFRIIAGPDGALWFTEQGAEKIGRISLKGVITHYPIPTSNSLPYALTVGPDRNIWFTERFSKKIGRLIPDAVQ